MTRSETRQDPFLTPSVLSYLCENIPDLTDVTGVEKTAQGQSNPTYILTTNRGKLVLRRKPPGELLKSAHAIDREFRVMSALAKSVVPVPTMLHYCADDTVLGAEFFVMTHVEGQNFTDPRCQSLSREERGDLYCGMNQTLASLHLIDVAAVGLSDFGRHEAYFERQLNRWTKQYRASETEHLPDLEDLMTWLSDNLPPEDEKVCLVHGDWRIDNLLFDTSTQMVSAVLDWELSTLGNPLADLGAQLMQWDMPTGLNGRGLDGVDRRQLGIPSNQTYLEYYTMRTGRNDVPDMTFPVAFSFFRMAAILQGVKFRALAGNASNPAKAMKLAEHIPTFATKALATISAAV